MSKAADAFRTISEVADDLDIPKHVLRFWELRFPQIKPMKRGGGRRYYRPEDVELLRGIHALLHRDGYTIRGVQKILRSRGVDHVKALATGMARPVDVQPPAAVAAPAKRSARKPAKPAAASTAAEAGDWRTQVGAVIRELEACRSILTTGAGGPARAAPASSKRRAAG